MTQERKDELFGQALRLIGIHLDEDENTVRALQQHLGMTAAEIAECGFQVEPTLNDVRQEFVMKLLECLDKRQGEWEKLEPGRLIDCAEEIAVAQHLVNELPNILKQGEMEYLLRFKDPLEVASSTWIAGGHTEIDGEEFSKELSEADALCDLDETFELTDEAIAENTAMEEKARQALEAMRAKRPRHQSQER